jgi:hypothetical protein
LEISNTKLLDLYKGFDEVVWAVSFAYVAHNLRL